MLKSRNKGTLVYSADLVPGEIADETVEVDQTDIDDSNDDDCYNKMDGNTKDVEACRVFNIAMETRGISQDAKVVADWHPDSSDLNFVIMHFNPYLTNYLTLSHGFLDFLTSQSCNIKLTYHMVSAARLLQYAKI